MTKRAKLLVIDDEASLRKLLRNCVPLDQFDLEEATTGQEGIQRVAEGMPDVVLLDLGLPDVDGLTVTRQIRTWTEVPIIILSARLEEQDKVGALDAGADDYLTKPFAIGELLARIRVALRHGTGNNPVFKTGDIHIDFSLRRIWKGKEEIHLTPYEFHLLGVLVKSAGKVVTHESLLRAVWGEPFINEVQYLRVYMGQLRRKLEFAPGRPRLITTEPGVGYRLQLME